MWARTSARTLALVTVLLAAGLLLAEASLYDRKRGFKTYRVGQEHMDKYVKAGDPHHVLNRHKNMEGLKEHPEIQRFLDWKKQREDGQPHAAAAFAGDIPHDFIPFLTEHKGAKAASAGEQAMEGMHMHDHGDF